MTFYTAAGKLDQAIAICLDYLRNVGIKWSAHPTRDEVLEEYAPIRRQIQEGSIERSRSCRS